MVGRSLDDRYPPREPDIGEIVFEVKNWSVYHPIHAERQVIKGIDINVRKGEVVGIAGLMGAGRTEFAMSLFGTLLWPPHHRRGAAAGASRSTLSSVGKAVEHGIAYVTEDRKTYGLNLIDHIKHNITLANLGGVSRHGVIDDLRELDVANDYRAQDQYPLVERLPDDRQSFGRQPAEGGAVEMAVRQSGSADPRRADARHRRRRQI